MHMTQEPQPHPAVYPLQTIANGLFSLLADYDFEPTEFFAALPAVLWGWFVAYPLLNTFTSSASFAAMSLVAPEWAWGCVVGTLGIVQWWLLAKRPHYRVIRARLALGAVMVWLFMWVLFLLGNFASTASVMYLPPVAMNIWCYLRLSLLVRGRARVG